eukprot:gene12362-biopygen562
MGWTRDAVVRIAVPPRLAIARITDDHGAVVATQHSGCGMWYDDGLCEFSFVAAAMPPLALRRYTFTATGATTPTTTVSSSEGNAGAAAVQRPGSVARIITSTASSYYSILRILPGLCLYFPPPTVLPP